MSYHARLLLGYALDAMFFAAIGALLPRFAALLI